MKLALSLSIYIYLWAVSMVFKPVIIRAPGQAGMSKYGFFLVVHKLSAHKVTLTLAKSIPRAFVFSRWPLVSHGTLITATSTRRVVFATRLQIQLHEQLPSDYLPNEFVNHGMLDH